MLLGALADTLRLRTGWRHLDVGDATHGRGNARIHIIRAILREIIPVNRVIMRDQQSYCGILLDDNNRKPICRLHFNGSKKYIGFFDGSKDQRDRPQEVRVLLEHIDDIYKHADRFKATISRYETKLKLVKEPDAQAKRSGEETNDTSKSSERTAS